ncbi:MAG: hypothetical protein AAGJ87_02395 [Pseudomonadota bacterium]
MTLPLSKALSASFAYFTAEAGRIVRVLWAPVLLFQIGAVLVMPLYSEALLGMFDESVAGDPEASLRALGPMFAWAGVITLAWLIYNAVCAAGLLRHLTRGEDIATLAYLRFGADELRVFFTTLLVGLILLIAYAGGILGVALVIGVAAAINSALGALLGLVGGIGFIVILALIALRLSLAAPAAIATRGLGVAPSWNAAKGCGWSLFGFWLIWGLIIVFVASVYSTLAMPDYFDDMAELMAAPEGSDEYFAINRRIMEESFAVWDPGNPRFALTFALGYLYMFALAAIAPVASGVAYRLVTEGQDARD